MAFSLTLDYSKAGTLDERMAHMSAAGFTHANQKGNRDVLLL